MCLLRPLYCNHDSTSCTRKQADRQITLEKLLRALLLQALYSVPREGVLMEQLDYNMLFRWFVGLNMDDPVWDVTVFITKNRERLLDGDIAEAFFRAVLKRHGNRICPQTSTSQ